LTGLLKVFGGLFENEIYEIIYIQRFHLMQMLNFGFKKLRCEKKNYQDKFPMFSRT
jgi:hypothetical protein